MPWKSKCVSSFWDRVYWSCVLRIQVFHFELPLYPGKTGVVSGQNILAAVLDTACIVCLMLKLGLVVSWPCAYCFGKSLHFRAHFWLGHGVYELWVIMVSGTNMMELLMWSCLSRLMEALEWHDVSSTFIISGFPALLLNIPGWVSICHTTFLVKRKCVLCAPVYFVAHSEKPDTVMNKRVAFVYFLANLLFMFEVSVDRQLHLFSCFWELVYKWEPSSCCEH